MIQHSYDSSSVALREFLKLESASGILLVIAGVLAMIAANTPLSELYQALLQTPIKLQVGAFKLDKTLLIWINDLLMAVFFFLVGLEIKRELIVGELRIRRNATLPIAGALGGMMVPALLFVALNAGTPAIRGWGIPMATDIAFALGVLALLGSRVGLQLKIFLLALAIVDDLGAVLVIAAFYTEQLDIGSLLLAGGALAGAFGYGRFGAARPLGYALIGAVVWYFMLKSGVHATVAGVLMALTVPLRHELSSEQLQDELRPVLEQHADGFEEVEVAIEHLEGVLDRAHSPLHAMEHALTPIVAFAIMPIFAFFNAGVAIAGGDVALSGPVSLGIVLGLVAGKPLGILLFAGLAVRVGITDLPAGATWSGMAGVALLAGIGFTMSLFIASLAFGDAPVLDEAKLGILVASLIAAGVGLVFLARTQPRAASD